MYNNNRNRGYGGNNNGSRGFGSRPSGPRRSFRSSGRGGGRGKQKFDLSLLVKKAELPSQTVVYTPEHTFSDFSLDGILLRNIQERGYTAPTPIQDQAVPHLLEGKDVVGIANTGTGKTAAFLIPLLNKIHKNRQEKVLIIAPTRELAVQIQDECKAFSRGMNIYSVLCIGGANIRAQIYGLQKHPHIVIGTPGRLKDLFNQRKLNFVHYSTIVLDEVDRMLDMGFIPDVKFIISHLPEKRQSVFFSATLSPTIENVMKLFSKDPFKISVKSQETAKNVDQDIIRTKGENKIDVLHQLLIKKEFSKVLIFGRTKWGIEKLNRELFGRGFAVASLHGNKTQAQRQKALDQFKQNRINILLATDIASRGLDISDVSHVINFDLPETYEDYVHRIGRTGRANKKGVALSFID